MSQQNKTTLQSAINTQLADNTSGDISAADVRDNLINMTDSLLFNTGSAQSLTGSLTVTEGITGSLQGTATTASFVVTAQTASYVATAQTASYVTTAQTASFVVTAQTASYVATAQTASYVAGGNVNGAVASATDAVNSALIYTSKTDTNGEFKVLFTDNLNLDDNSDVYKENGSTFTYNPGLNRLSLSRILADNITGSLQGTATAAVSASYATTASVLLGSVTSASYAVTASLSNETIGAGDLGSIQFKGGTGPGSVEGKNTWSSTFSWNVFNSGLNIGDPNNTGGYGTGDYYLAVGYDALAAGFAAAFGSSSYASGEGSFTHGKAITAIGNYSHAEGLGTIASGSYQHVQGRYNTQGDTTSLMIVGNGTTTNARKDAFKVRMSGSIVLPTTQSAAPSWTGADGEMVFATVTGAHYFYVWMAGAWRSGSLS